jgi:PhnB protein
MNTAILFNFNVDKKNNTIYVGRSFNAPLDLVWAAWTEAEILDQWWAPKPYQAVTKSMNFDVGGHWHYYMLGPEGDIHWCLFKYDSIDKEKHFSGIDAFCDESANINNTKPRVKWKNEFSEEEDSTLVNILLHFISLEDLETIIQMGFKEGFTAGLENLDKYIKAQFYLRKQNKPDNKARVSSYVNFPGKTEFINGIQRFGDIPAEARHPPIAENVKKMVLQVELPLLGNHVLMATDSPLEMGFTVIPGNNMHINLEPESREEAKRIFNALSEGGKVEMPLQDMFWGAYYGSFTDRFGINWMVNYQSK